MHFAAIFVLFKIWNDLFCSYVDHIRAWRFFLESQSPHTNLFVHNFVSEATWNSRNMIAKTRRYILRRRSCWRRRLRCISSLICCKGTSFTKLQSLWSPLTSRKEHLQSEFEGRTHPTCEGLINSDFLVIYSKLFIFVILETFWMEWSYALSVLSIRVHTTIELYAWARKRRHTRSHTPSWLFLGSYWGTSTSTDRQEPTSRGAQLHKPDNLTLLQDPFQPIRSIA